MHKSVRSAPELQNAIEATINRDSRTPSCRPRRLPAELALLSADRQCLKLLRVQALKSNGRSAVLADVNLLCLRSVHYGGDMDRRLILMTLGAKPRCWLTNARCGTAAGRHAAAHGASESAERWADKFTTFDVAGGSWLQRSVWGIISGSAFCIRSRTACDMPPPPGSALPVSVRKTCAVPNRQ